MTQQKENNFLLHGGILAAASVIVRFIGLIYRIPMVNIIGSEGNGYYSTAYSVYSILLLLSSYSLPLAVSKMVSARTATGKWKETMRVLIVALVYAFVFGTAFALLTYFLADFFCGTVMKSPMAALPLKWMAPTVFIVAFLGVLRGFFQGMQTTIPTAISQILEQIVNAAVSVGMAAILVQYGVEVATARSEASYGPAWGAAGGTIGTGAGALIALIFCIVIFIGFSKHLRKYVKRDKTTKKIESYSGLTRILFLTAVPVILSTASYNCVDIIDNAVFNNYMNRAGYTFTEYNSIWGDYNSAYLLIVHLPIALASAIGAALVPSLTAAFELRDREAVLSKIALTVRVTLLIAIPCAFGLIAIGGNLAKLLFGGISEEAQKYLVAGGLAVIFYSLATVTNAILQGLDHVEKPMLHALISLVVHTLFLLLFLFVFKLEIFAVILAYVIFSMVMCALNLISIYRLTGYTPEPVHTILLPAGISAILVMFCFLISFIFSRFLSGRIMHLMIVVVCLIFGAALYFAGILLTGCLTKEQILELPFGERILGFSEKLHLVR